MEVKLHSCEFNVSLLLVLQPIHTSVPVDGMICDSKSTSERKGVVRRCHMIDTYTHTAPQLLALATVKGLEAKT
jgi:hypothetical protein